MNEEPLSIGGTIPPEPLGDENPNSFDSRLQRTGDAKCVLYLCCVESSKSFRDGLVKCEASLRDGEDVRVHRHCFQRDGTRHVSLWQGTLTLRQARALIGACRSQPDLPLRTVRFAKGWNSWKGGNYIGLLDSDTETLRGWKTRVFDRLGFSKRGKPNCDHLSLYRKRGNGGGTTNAALAKVSVCCLARFVIVC